MPISPNDGERAAGPISEGFQDAERGIFARIRRALLPGLGRDSWAAERLAATPRLRRAISTLIPSLRERSAIELRQAVLDAYGIGARAANADLTELGLPVLPDTDAAHARRLADAVLQDFDPLYARILREGLDVYRGVIAEASQPVLEGRATRIRAAQRALDDFATRGITGFTDRAGRNWELTSYIEMAVRTATGRAAVQAHVDQLRAAGHDLVVVSDAPWECPLCRPWERRVLSITGSTPGYPTLDAARAAGLQHPSCRHSISLWQPGLSRPTVQPEGQATYEDTQKQRYLERQVRAWKRREQAGFDDAARERARASVRAYQARLRELTRETGLKRKPSREQTGIAR
ncbi:phage minor capsid protein [Streptomyces sp. NPDC002547]